MSSYFTGNGETGLHRAYREYGLNWHALNVLYVNFIQSPSAIVYSFQQAAERPVTALLADPVFRLKTPAQVDIA